MARTKQYQPELVVDVAMDVFWSQGYGATSVEDLAAATGLSRSSLYAEYGSKRALFGSAVDHYLQYLSSLLAPVADGGLEAVVAFFKRTGAGLGGFHRGCLMANGMAELGQTDDDFKRDAARYRSMIREALTVALEAAESTGQTEPGVSERRAEFLTTQLLGLFVELRSREIQSDSDAAASIVAEVASWQRLSFQRRLGKRG